jgi:CSLREA domain-containing protein
MSGDPIEGNGGPGRTRKGRTTLGVLTAVLCAGPVVLMTSPAAHAASGARSVQPRLIAPGPTFTVNTTVDSHDATPGDGICADGTSQCSLRAAIEEADALSKSVTITVPTGTYLLSLGALNVTDPAGVTINGAGQGTTVVDGTPESARILTLNEDVNSNGAFVTASNLTLRKGAGSDGGGVAVNDNNDNLVLNSVTVADSTATTEGGGIYNLGALWMNNSTVSGSTAPKGGGIYNDGVSFELVNTTVINNVAHAIGGGIYTNNPTTIEGGSISGNMALTSSGTATAGGLAAEEVL